MQLAVRLRREAGYHPTVVFIRLEISRDNLTDKITKLNIRRGFASSSFGIFCGNIPHNLFSLIAGGYDRISLSDKKRPSALHQLAASTLVGSAADETKTAPDKRFFFSYNVRRTT
jgi:hypothetical protein